MARQGVDQPVRASGFTEERYRRRRGAFRFGDISGRQVHLGEVEVGDALPDLVLGRRECRRRGLDRLSVVAELCPTSRQVSEERRHAEAVVVRLPSQRAFQVVDGADVVTSVGVDAADPAEHPGGSVVIAVCRAQGERCPEHFECVVQPHFAHLNNYYAPSLNTDINRNNTGAHREVDDTDTRCPGYGEETSSVTPETTPPCGAATNNLTKLDLIMARESKIVGSYTGDALAVPQDCVVGACSDHRVTIGTVTLRVQTP